MTTEILTVFVVVGTIVVFLAMRQLRGIYKEQEQSLIAANSPEEIEKDANMIRKELEQTADEIIQRMSVRIDRLELLLRDADRKANLLQHKLEMIEKTEGISKPRMNPDEEFAKVLADSMAEENADTKADAETLSPASMEPAELEDDDFISYSMDLAPEEVEAYIQSRSADEIPDKPVKSLVDEEPEEYIPTGQATRDNHPQEQAAYLMQQMNRK